MSKVTVKGFIVATKRSWEKKPTFTFQTYKPSAEFSPDSVAVCEQEIKIEVPDNYNITAPLVANLEEKKRLLRVEMAKQLMEIDEKISKLTCIEHTPEAA